MIVLRPRTLQGPGAVSLEDRHLPLLSSAIREIPPDAEVSE